MNNKLVCFRCFKKIDPFSNYYTFTEFDYKKTVNTDYAHRVCWDEFMKQVGNSEEAMGVIRQLKEPLRRMGIIKEEEYIIR